MFRRCSRLFRLRCDYRGISPPMSDLARTERAGYDMALIWQVHNNSYAVFPILRSDVAPRSHGAFQNPRGQAPPPVPPSLGAWRLASIDGRTIAPDASIELLLRPRYLEWRSGCVAEVRELEREGDRLLPGKADPYPVCERGRSKAELLAGRLFSGAVALQMRPDGRLRLQGSGVAAELEPLGS